MMTEFVDGWLLGHTLGEGAYGEVKLVINKVTREAVAMKMVDLSKHPDARQAVKKESTIHRMLSNPNIIQYFGQRSEKNMEYIFLEYASGGELFDKIEPDVGMPIWEAQKYFQHLISAVEYLHSRGVAHRDLKPENLLLDDKDNLKITDFGLATIYRMHGRERNLDTRCGTLPYVAPEVLERQYRAEPADIWSCGIILVALLAGELPWDQSSADCPEYEAWKNGKYVSMTPWKKIDTLSLSLIRKILVHEPMKRIKISEIKKHHWFINKFSEDGNHVDRDVVDGFRSKRLLIEDEDSLTKICYSQPEIIENNINSNTFTSTEYPNFSFSQPAHMEDLLLSTQLPNTQPNTQTSQNSFQRLVRRMTRFFVSTECDSTVQKLMNSLMKYNYNHRMNGGIITISTVDRRKMPLVFKASIHDMDGRILVDFRLSKGCGLEFKRRFLKIKADLKDIITRGPVPLTDIALSS
ncbi:serine/threonine-protein kinase grp [Leptopilina heterotoma]|uniref:serine/threonine-protein kinase grp n=1 Tax=Leptopilina heterotoma TaxID=63436 RepID=UPI001CA986A1|nr:serine/threonine-protein kinase grp [Leptopilina heterotoma]XP_043462970.1 serine/threonine-protein kinase grp [Leptopilina heterotoma]